MSNKVEVDLLRSIGPAYFYDRTHYETGLRLKEGTNRSMGSATMVAGAVTVSTTDVTATSRIFLTPQNASGTAGSVYVSARVAGTSFTITSTSGTDTRDVAWIIFEPI